MRTRRRRYLFSERGGRDTPHACWHCVCMEELGRRSTRDDSSQESGGTGSPPLEPPRGVCPIRVTLSRNSTSSSLDLRHSSCSSVSGSSLSPAPSPQPPARICRSPSPKLERQAALQRADLDPDEEDDDDDWEAFRQSSLPSVGSGRSAGSTYSRQSSALSCRSWNSSLYSSFSRQSSGYSDDIPMHAHYLPRQTSMAVSSAPTSRQTSLVTHPPTRQASLAARSAPPSRQSSRQVSFGTTASQLSRDSAADSADRSWFLGSSSDIGEYTEIWLEVPELVDRPSSGPIRRCASAEPAMSPRHAQSLEAGLLLEVNDWPPVRSTSVDIGFPTEEECAYTAYLPFRRRSR